MVARRLSLSVPFAAALLAGVSTASAEVSCDQIGVVAQASVQYRDEGHSLKQVLDAIGQLKGNEKVTNDDLKLLQAVARAAYTREKGVYEIVEECRAARRPVPWYCRLGGC
jgi:hypothetical protein